jgi:hypothetical protein
LKATSIQNAQRLEDMPNIAKQIAADLRTLGYMHPTDLARKDPYEMYDRLCAITGIRQDPCLLDTFIAATRFADGGPAVPWWAYTTERKQTMTTRSLTPTS